MDLVKLFLKYVAFDTTSNEESATYPSVESELKFADILVEDLKSVGVSNAYKDEFGLVYGFIDLGKEKTMGFISHMDTSPEIAGGLKNPRIIEKYDGSDIALNDKYTLRLKDFKGLEEIVGDDIIVTDGEHLLGADDKAGITLTFGLIDYVLNNKDKVDYNISICFTPDEEIGNGWRKFDVNKMKADVAFTLDGGSIYEANHENFNAAHCEVNVKGISIHPGSAKDIMVNAASIAAHYHSLLPKDMTPECTDGYDGFIHLVGMDGAIEDANLYYILREFDKDKLEAQKKLLNEAKEKVLKIYPRAKISVNIGDSYKNMGDYFVINPYAIELINKAYLRSGVRLKHTPIRGGTDGAMITYMGLPCPNLGNGGFNFHGRYELLSINQMYKMLDILKELVKEINY